MIMAPSFDQLNVLVVHNNEPMRAIISDMLEAFGFDNVTEVARTSTAFEILARHQVDLIVAQYENDAPVGLQLTTMVRTAEDNLDPDLPIIFITLSAEDDAVQKAFRCGANAAIASPINAKELFSTIYALFEREKPQVKSSHYVGPDRRKAINRETHHQDRRYAQDMVPLRKSA
ncbi:MAG: response regulator [Alphaproteobacteria bacterium]|nr:MAG: response regulator [Alphaproteobacteria bacterium]